MCIYCICTPHIIIINVTSHSITCYYRSITILYIYIHLYMCKYVCVCVYVYIYMYIHILIYRHLLSKHTSKTYIKHFKMTKYGEEEFPPPGGTIHNHIGLVCGKCLCVNNKHTLQRFPLTS